MAPSKKNAAPSETAVAEKAPAAAPAPELPVATKSAAVKSAAAKPVAKKPAAPAKSAAKPAAKKPSAPKAAKPLDPAVQASKEALAKALAAAQAVKIEKPLGKPVKAEKVEKAEKPAKEAKAVKPKKAKLVRDSFTMPENEYARIAELKKRLLDKGVVAKKSELLRAGVAVLAALDDAGLAAAMEKVEIIKTGRPAKSGK